MTKILALSGSLRTGSYNTQLAKAAVGYAREHGADATYFDLRAHTIPMYDEDLERTKGIPDDVMKLKNAMREVQGLIFACPEYNSSISAALKNAIDWASRPEPNQPSLSCFSGKAAALFSASPGALGGLRGLVHVRSILGNIGVLVLPGQFALTKSHEAFDAAGNMKDEKQIASVKGIAGELVRIATCIKPK